MIMARIPEPELMNEEAQVLAYACADFEQPHQMFIDLYCEYAKGHVPVHVLDLGCGPADITTRFAHAFPQCVIDAVDGAENMLCHARKRLEQEGLCGRVSLIQACLPDDVLPDKTYDCIISNSLLHHLADANVLWQTILKHGKSGASVFIMDLYRPESKAQAQMLVQHYAAAEPEILRHDFYHSLLAAYRKEEIENQLHQQGLAFLEARLVSDRHIIIYGKLK